MSTKQTYRLEISYFVLLSMIFCLSCKERNFALKPIKRADCQPGDYCGSLDPEEDPLAIFSDEELKQMQDILKDDERLAKITVPEEIQRAVNMMIAEMVRKGEIDEFKEKHNIKDKSEPDEVSDKKAETLKTPSVNACDIPKNKSLSVNGQIFKLTEKTFTVYATKRKGGGYADFAGDFDGNLKSAKSSFSFYLKNGKLTPSPGKDLKKAKISVSGKMTPFAEIKDQTYFLSGQTFNAKFDLKKAGACLAVYGDYSGGSPVLVMPN